MKFKIDWIDRGREPKCQPNPAYPTGVDVDYSTADAPSCRVDLPYPAKRCGVYVVECETCGLVVGITTAGRPDDPKSLRVPCKRTLQ